MITMSSSFPWTIQRPYFLRIRASSGISRELVRVAETIANVQGNIIKLEHNQFVSTNRNAAVELRITMEAFGTDR